MRAGVGKACGRRYNTLVSTYFAWSGGSNMVLTLEIRIIAGNQAHLRVGEITRRLVRFFVAGLALAAAAHSKQAAATMERR